MTHLKRVATAGLAGLIAVPLLSTTAPAQQPYIGEVKLWGMSWCPRGWTPANGQLLEIERYTALFSLYGTTYGGDGRTNFGVPSLQGRAAMSSGRGPGLSSYTIGQRAGETSFTVDTNTMASHNHAATTSPKLRATDAGATTGTPGDQVALAAATENIYRNTPVTGQLRPESVTATTTVQSTGSGQTVSYRGPYLAMTWCVALDGIYPPRN
ncbi:MAG: tail fiber protein [Sphingomonadales bacterium]|nr:tail fiber protein [Sphingomonadales bacterium]